MRLLRIFILAILPLSTVSFNPLKASELVISRYVGCRRIDPKGAFEISEILSSNSHRRPIYNKAIIELKRIQEEPICHRLAAQLLMNTCRGLQDINEETLEANRAKLERNHVESFAIALTLCDMERFNYVIPKPCLPLSNSTMRRVVENQERTLVIAQEHVESCLKTLAQDEKHLATWLSRRDSALLFCRSASMDMDKDQLFESQKMLVKVMEDFTSELSDELQQLKINVVDHARDADSYFEGFMDHAENIKSKIHSTMEYVSNDIKDVASSILSIRKSGADVQRFLQNIFQNAVDGNAEMIVQQAQALAASTDKVQSRLDSINSLAEKTEAYAMVLGRAMESLSSRLGVLSDQQEVLGEKSENVLTALVNATESLQYHANQLQQASVTATNIHESLGNVAMITNLVSTAADHFHFGGSLGDWVIRIITPPSVMLLGSYGLPPSLARNAFLFFSGGVLSQLWIYNRHQNSWEWCSETFMPSTFTQLARSYIPNSSLKPSPSISALKVDTQTSHLDMS